MRKRLIALIMMFVIIFSMSTVANAAFFASEYINSCYAYTNASSNGQVKVSFNIRATGTMDVLGVQTIIIQEQAPGSSRWTSIATLSSDDYSNMLKYNASYHSSDVYYYGGKSGYSYRAKVYFYAEKGGYDTQEYITY